MRLEYHNLQKANRKVILYDIIIIIIIIEEESSPGKRLYLPAACRAYASLWRRGWA